jgi:hypothetical protein
MPTFLLHHKHRPEECAIAIALAQLPPFVADRTALDRVSEVPLP